MMERHPRMLRLLAEARPQRLDPGPRRADPAAITALPQEIGEAVPAQARLRGRRTPVRWLPRLGWRSGLAMGLAMAVAAGLTVAQSVGPVDEHGRARSILPGLPGAEPAAAAVLNHAASVASARPFTPPRPDQWEYLEFRIGRAGEPVLVSREWRRADGKQMAGYRGRLTTDGKVLTQDGRAFAIGDRLDIAAVSPTNGPIDYPTLASLPSAPKALLRWLERYQARLPHDPGAVGRPATPEEHNQFLFGALTQMLLFNVLPPRVEAVLFRAMASIPGVSLEPNAPRVNGRPTLGVQRTENGCCWAEVLLDPGTYHVVGERFSPDRKQPGAGGVATLSVRTTARIVDRAGQAG
jgi:hypothetical protein